ncbi:hypothetical protein [Aliivibrio fischeri]|uniref:Uncharacterized protein n=1 Tax=Aliivibrio fischeri TaxID=668 RepID=A0A510UN17_ALIFS|nr:hypothetical protein [Aliivibrio fischeri]MUK51198.1 hypothetical protein [Aliivibrio fischeri]GEK15846.1 hypothetical protein AFI02nite_38820 [Aliivibrio fischeri]
MTCDQQGLDSKLDEHIDSELKQKGKLSARKQPVKNNITDMQKMTTIKALYQEYNGIAVSDDKSQIADEQNYSPYPY